MNKTEDDELGTEELSEEEVKALSEGKKQNLHFLQLDNHLVHKEQVSDKLMHRVFPLETDYQQLYLQKSLVTL
jgi:hypothetical protein